MLLKVPAEYLKPSIDFSGIKTKVAIQFSETYFLCHW